MSIEEDHTQVGLQLLGNNENLLAVFDGEVPRPIPDPPYVVVYTRVAYPRDGVGMAVDMAQVGVTTTMTCHCVGLTSVAARVVAMQVRSSLINVRPIIAGRSCAPYKETAATDPNFDDTTGKPVFDQTLVFEFMTTG